jgi:hypothetical protein
MLKQWLLLFVRILGGLILIGLAEMFRRLSFIAPDWRGSASPEAVLSFAFVLAAFFSFACGFWLIYEAVGNFRQRLGQRAERVRIRRNRDKTFRKWLSSFREGGEGQ